MVNDEKRYLGIIIGETITRDRIIILSVLLDEMEKVENRKDNNTEIKKVFDSYYYIKKFIEKLLRIEKKDLESIEEAKKYYEGMK